MKDNVIFRLIQSFRIKNYKKLLLLYVVVITILIF